MFVDYAHTKKCAVRNLSLYLDAEMVKLKEYIEIELLHCRKCKLFISK